MSKLPSVLVIDDEVRSVEALERILEDDFNVLKATSVREAEAILADETVQVVLCDQRMPGVTGVEFLKTVRERWPEAVRMIISGYTDAEDIIQGVNEAGIYQYVTKPWQPENLTLTLKNAIRLYDLQRQNQLLAVELKMSSNRAEKIVASRREGLREHYHAGDGIVRAADSPMNAVCEHMRRVAPYDVSVLLTGESGTGKQLVARALHYNSLRWNRPFVVQSCAALPDETLESELFGHRRGAFAGAIEEHIGLFERAGGGTVFLDGVSELSPAFQAKLLRVLQEGEIRSVGGRQTRPIDVRVIAAANRDLQAKVQAGRFREDLYYQIATVPIQVPALRERRMDIPVIAKTLLERAQKQLGKTVKGLSQEAFECLKTYGWPGNVRELHNEIQHLLVMGPEGGVIGAEHLSPHFASVSLGRCGQARFVDCQSRRHAARAHRSPGGLHLARKPHPPPLEQEQGRERAGPVARGPPRQARTLWAGEDRGAAREAREEIRFGDVMITPMIPHWRFYPPGVTNEGSAPHPSPLHMGEGARLQPLRGRPLSHPHPLADTLKKQARQGELARERRSRTQDFWRVSQAAAR
jgi:two-component system response regulator HupR/HoxA